MYVINMKITKNYNNREYVFDTRKKCQTFLEQLNNFEIDSIISIEKYNKHSVKNAFYDFFNY